MTRIPRIGLFFGPSIDPFWVQVLEAIYQKAHEVGADLIAIDSDLPPLPSGEEKTALYEELLAQDLDVVIGWGFPEDMAPRPGLRPADRLPQRDGYAPSAVRISKGAVRNRPLDRRAPGGETAWPWEYIGGRRALDAGAG